MRHIIIAVAAAMTLTLAACGPYQLSESERQTAELGARDIAERSGADFVGCSGSDSDNDGYVTCTIKGKSAPNATSDLLCSFKNGARGCKRKG